MYIQQILLANGEWENCSWVDDMPCFYATKEEAREDLNEFYRELKSQGSLQKLRQTHEIQSPV